MKKLVNAIRFNGNLFGLAALVLNSISMNYYIYRIFNDSFEWRIMSNWWLYNTGLLLIASYINNNGSFNQVCMGAVLCNIILLILNNHGFLICKEWMFGYFNGSILVVSIMILISGGRHGLFKKNTYNAI